MLPELRLLPRHHEGRDLKRDQTLLKLPYAPRLRLLFLDCDGNERAQECSYAWARTILKRAGYQLHDGRERWTGGGRRALR